MAGDNVGKLRYVIQNDVSNPTTLGTVKAALDGKTAPEWPGKTFSMGTSQGKAILGSPNGIGTAYMLFNHKTQLGRKTVDSITVYTIDGDLYMVFHIIDVQ